MRFSTPLLLIGGGVLLFLLGLLCGSHLSSSSSSSSKNDDPNRQTRRRLLRFHLFDDPRTVTFKEGSNPVYIPPSPKDINVAAAPGPGLDPISNFNQFSSPDLQTQQQQQVQQQQFQPQQPGEEARDVHVSSMCRCPSDTIPRPHVNEELLSIYQTVPKNNRYQQGYHEAPVIQPPSKATGSYHKRFVHHPVGGCECREGNGILQSARTIDKFLPKISRAYFDQTCGLNNPETEIQTKWDQMPDFGVEDRPIFAGILSYESPLSLNNSLHNWLDNDLFHRIAAQDVFVQLNHRSNRDDDILDGFLRNKLNGRHPMTITGAPEENLNPGMAISKFCRMAEQHPSSHPNGENLLLFLEKDWILPASGRDTKKLLLESIFRSAIALSQRGVPYIGLWAALREADNNKMWNCPAEGIPWFCATARHHRWTNWPALIDCNWFLRYLEPFALMSMTDPITWCGRSDGYCDWKKAMQDGRIAWTNSHWIIAHLGNGRGQLFVHEEVDK